jgi:pre-mRNA 3'-end-processing factor FIP1
MDEPIQPPPNIGPRTNTLLKIQPGKSVPGKDMRIEGTATTPASQRVGGIAGSTGGGGGGGVNINAVGMYEGRSILDVDPESLEDKPWRKPGADITDYFNFGFNEFTWRAYCSKQKAIRDEQGANRRINVCETCLLY